MTLKKFSILGNNWIHIFKSPNSLYPLPKILIMTQTKLLSNPLSLLGPIQSTPNNLSLKRIISWMYCVKKRKPQKWVFQEHQRWAFLTKFSRKMKLITLETQKIEVSKLDFEFGNWKFEKRKTINSGRCDKVWKKKKQEEDEEEEDGGTKFHPLPPFYKRSQLSLIKLSRSNIAHKFFFFQKFMFS